MGYANSAVSLEVFSGLLERFNATTSEQRELHAYFQPAEDLTVDLLIAHRRLVTKQRPSLPQRAGKALAKFDRHASQDALARVRAARQSATSGQTNAQGKGRKITVRAIARPEIDIPKLARALRQLAEQMLSESDPPRPHRRPHDNP